ncbi:hypothetical protein [Kocuria sp. CPCC 205263]|uniref:hypothetical protein n=1 Tax=Kocuria sp. CPCC 205263 TaxID=3073555 RepID=UPI0034D4B386
MSVNEPTQVTPEEQGENPVADERLFARFGNFILKLPHGSLSSDEVHAALMEALRADSRVKALANNTPEHSWTENDRWYPAWSNAEWDQLVSGSDSFYSKRFFSPIAFEVFVPLKNQPKIHGENPMVDTYDVAWDGCTAVVTWHRGDAEEDAPPAVGQVVVDILREVCKNAGYALYVQACSVACEHLFVHKEIRVNRWDAKDYSEQFHPEGSREIDLNVYGRYGRLQLVLLVHNLLASPSADFARLKNIARRTLDLDYGSQITMHELIAHDYETLRRSQEGILKRLGFLITGSWGAIKGNGRRKRANFLIASLWLAMSNLEALQRLFREAERRYNDSVRHSADPELFIGDLKSDEARVGEINPFFARAAVEHKATRLDNTIVVWATAGGAITGAAITAAAGGLLN